MGLCAEGVGQRQDVGFIGIISDIVEGKNAVSTGPSRTMLE